MTANSGGLIAAMDFGFLPNGMQPALQYAVWQIPQLQACKSWCDGPIRPRRHAAQIIYMPSLSQPAPHHKMHAVKLNRSQMRSPLVCFAGQLPLVQSFSHMDICAPGYVVRKPFGSFHATLPYVQDSCHKQHSHFIEQKQANCS